MKPIVLIFLIFFPSLVLAQNKVLYLHPEITTHILLPEDIVSVDMSSTKVAMQQASPKLLLIKPFEGNPEFLGVVSIVCTSFIIQLELLPGHAHEADRLVSIASSEGTLLARSSWQLTEEEMRKFSQSLLSKKTKSFYVSEKKQGVTLVLASVHAMGAYLFLEVEIENATQVPLNLRGIEFVLQDKPGGKRTNAQEIPLIPEFVLMEHSMILKHFRNVYVLKAERYPGPKLLEIRMTEGAKGLRLGTLEIPYQKLLAADSF